MRKVLIALAMLALALPVCVSASTYDDASAAYVSTMSDLGIAASAPGNGADVAVGNGTAVACPNGPPPPDGLPCFFSSRGFQFAGESDITAGEAHGILNETFINPQTGQVIGSLRGNIFCVTVNGNYGEIGVVVTQSTATSGALVVGGITYLPMIDNGKAGDPAPDLFGPNYVGFPEESLDGQCIDQFTPELVVTDGDIKVHDGQVAGA